MSTLILVLQEEEGFVVYENHMSSSYEVGVGPRGSITRDSHFECVHTKSICLICFVTHWGFLRCKVLCSLPTGYCSSVDTLVQLWRFLSWRWMLFLHLCLSLLQDPSEWSSDWEMDSVTQKDVWRVRCHKSLNTSYWSISYKLNETCFYSRGGSVSLVLHSIRLSYH